MDLTGSVFLSLLGLIGSFIGTLAGGGGLLTLPAMMLFGIPAHFGIGINKFSFVCASVFNVVQIFKEKLLPGKVLLSGTIIGLAGGLIGGLITSNINEEILNIVVIVLLSFALFITMLKKPVKEDQESHPYEKSLILQNIFAFFIGIYDGGFGPGSSTLGIMMFINRGYHYIQAVYLTRLLILGSASGAMMVFWKNGFINWNYAIPLTLGSIIGTQIGFKVLPKISQKAAKTMLMLVTVLLIVQIFLKMVL